MLPRNASFYLLRLFIKHFTEVYKKYDDKVIWKMSEVFNDAILKLQEFVAITGQKDPEFYAETQQELNNAVKL